MELTQTTKHILTFQVKEFISTDGGMEEEEFGPIVTGLNCAVHNLELARTQYPKSNWVIVCYVDTIIS